MGGNPQDGGGQPLAAMMDTHVVRHWERDPPYTSPTQVLANSDEEHSRIFIDKFFPHPPQAQLPAPSNDPLPTRDWLALSVEEIAIALAACENDSAPGPSQILYKAIKWAWEAHPLTLEYLYSNCINKGKYLLPFKPLLTAVAPK